MSEDNLLNAHIDLHFGKPSNPKKEPKRPPRPKLENVSSRYGAQMGRKDILPDDRQGEYMFFLQRLPWVDGDYDPGGAYWGCSDPNESIFWAEAPPGENTDGARMFIRAKTFIDAKNKVREAFPNAGFYRI